MPKYVIVATRTIPVEPGSDTMVKKVYKETTIDHITKWLHEIEKGNVCLTRVEIVKAS